MLIKLPRPSVLVLIGVSGSGKSTFCQKHFRWSEIVSSDRLREVVSDQEDNQEVSADAFDLLFKILDYRLKHKRRSIVDSTGLSHEFRARVIKAARHYSAHVACLIFNIPADMCVTRNKMRNREVPKEIMDAQIEKFQKAREAVRNEGFDAIHEVDELLVNIVKFETDVKRMDHFGDL